VFEELEEKWAERYPAIGQLWRNAWEQVVPFLDYHAEIRTVLFGTNAIESLNARYRRAITVRGHLSDRAGRPEVLLPGDQVPGPQGHRPATMDHALEASAQRIRHHLRRPDAGSTEPVMRIAAYTLSRTDPWAATVAS
jgi:hypothetical protein